MGSEKENKMKKNALHLLALPLLFALSSGAVGCLENEVLQVKAENSYIVNNLYTSTGITSDSDWEGVETYAMSGPNGGTVAFVSSGTSFFFRMEMPDTTPVKNKDKIDFTFVVDGKTQGQQGNMEMWLVEMGGLAFGTNVQTEFSYDETNQKYVAVIGFNLGSSYQIGAQVSATVNFHDVTDGGTQSWGQGEANSFSGTLYLESTTPAKESTYIIPAIRPDRTVMAASDWTGVETYSMVGVNGGTVAFATSGTCFFFRMEMPDTTPIKDKEKIDFKFVVDGKTHGEQGNFAPWLTADGAMDFGGHAQMEMSYDETNQKYVAVIGFEIGSSYSPGATISATVNYHDATEATQEWGQGAANAFTHDLTFAEVPEALAYARTFLAASLCDNGVNAPSTTLWAELKTSYEALSTEAQGELTAATSDASSWDEICQMAARYDLIVSRYGYDDFMNRGISLSLQSNLPSFHSSSTLWAILLLGIAGVGAVGMMFFLRKKKD